MLARIFKSWFLFALIPLIAIGMTGGAHGEGSAAARLVKAIPSSPTTALIMLVMSFSLDSGKLAASFRSPGPVIFASAINLGVAPLFALLLAPLQQTPDFRYGLMIAGSVPCTLAAASVWTRKSGGNDAISLLVTLLTNALCVIVTPLWLKALAGAASVDFDAATMMLTLAASVLLPSIVGQLLRLLPLAIEFARARKVTLGLVAQLLILTLAFQASWGAGERLHQTAGGMRVSAVLIVWACCFGIHLATMWLGWIGGRWLRFDRGDAIAVMFAASQKTLPVGLFLATNPRMFGNPDFLAPGVGVPFAVFPMLMFHASQLIFDTLVADRLHQQT